MKNNKGFSLIEVIVAITIIAILMIIAIPSINNILKNSKTQISSLMEKNIEEAAKLYGQEIFMCNTEDIIELPESEAITCIDAKEKLTTDEGILVTIGFLKDKGYFTDKASKCDPNGEIKVSLENTKIKVELLEVQCN